MRVLNFRTAAVALVAGVGLAGCAYGPYSGLGVGVSYGDPYYGRYSSPYYGGYSPYSRYGYGLPYYGWYDGFYYPGTGYYVYDRYRNPYRWTDAQRKYWEWRRSGSPQASGGFSRIVQNWADFQNGPDAGSTSAGQQSIQRSVSPRSDVRQRRVIEQRQASSSEVRQQRRVERQARSDTRREAREERRRLRDSVRTERQDDN